MKIPLLIAALGLAITSAQAQTYVNFIRQQQQQTGVIWDMPVASQGTGPAFLLAEEGGALFQLWTIAQLNSKDYLLDQKLVGAYLPKGTIKIQTLDSYNGIPRIRVDQPFTVDFDISGLQFGANIPISASSVLAEHHLAPNPGGTVVITPAQAISGVPHSSTYIGKNGLTSVSYAGSSIKAADPTKARGEEHFVLHALGEGQFTQTQIASAFLQVWPLASGTISGIAEGEIVRGSPPVLTVRLDDLYPRSDSYIRIYSTGKELGELGAVIPGSMLVLDQEFPASRLLTVKDYGNLFDSEGAYRIELLTKTPFGIDRLHSINFKVNRTIRVNAMIVDADSAKQ